MNIPGRNPQTSDYLVVSKMDLNVGTEEMYAWSPVRSSVRSYHTLYEVLFVRSTNSTKFSSFVLQTLRCSVHLLNKNERLFCTFDLQLNVVMTSTIDISTIVLRTDGSSTRVTRSDLVYWKGTLFSQLINVLSTALISSYCCLWNA